MKCKRWSKHCEIQIFSAAIFEFNIAGLSNPRAACSPRGNFVRPVKSYNFIGIGYNEPVTPDYTTLRSFGSINPVFMLLRWATVVQILQKSIKLL